MIKKIEDDGHHAHHGGAWKVAYADVVTGMMSLFLVLWILSQDEEVIIATTRFFRDPYKAGVPKSTPVEQRDARPGSMVDQIVGRSDTTMRNTNDTTSIDIDVLHRIAQQRLETAGQPLILRCHTARSGRHGAMYS